MSTKEIISLIAGVLPVIALIIYSIQLALNSKPGNAATWVMWCILDIVITINSISAGNKGSWLPAGFALGAFLVSVVLISKGKWKWGFVEITCSIGSAVAMIYWYNSAPKGAVIASCIAMWIASIPIMIGTWKMPERNMWWFWGIGAMSAFITAIVAKAWSIEDRLFPVSSFIFNSLMTLLVLRKAKPVVAETKPKKILCDNCGSSFMFDGHCPDCGTDQVPIN